MPPQDADPSAEAALQVWRDIATWWDGRIGDGNAFQRELIMPATDRLLALEPDESVLDCCCGNGNYSRRMAAEFSAKVTAFDGAPAFINAARKYAGADAIRWHVADATAATQLQLVSAFDHQWDAVVCSMALMDLPDISPLLAAVSGWLKPAGRFVFSVPHPCFSSNRPAMTAELINHVAGEGQGLSQTFGVRVDRYITPQYYLSTGILNQPQRHPFWHRPLSVLLAECFNAGLVLDGLEEPTFAADKAASAKNAFTFAKRPEIPPAIVVRLRPA